MMAAGARITVDGCAMRDLFVAEIEANCDVLESMDWGATIYRLHLKRIAGKRADWQQGTEWCLDELIKVRNRQLQAIVQAKRRYIANFARECAEPQLDMVFDVVLSMQKGHGSE